MVNTEVKIRNNGELHGQAPNLTWAGVAIYDFFKQGSHIMIAPMFYYLAEKELFGEHNG